MLDSLAAAERAAARSLACSAVALADARARAAASQSLALHLRRLEELRAAPASSPAVEAARRRLVEALEGAIAQCRRALAPAAIALPPPS